MVDPRWRLLGSLDVIPRHETPLSHYSNLNCHFKITIGLLERKWGNSEGVGKGCVCVFVLGEGPVKETR